MTRESSDPETQLTQWPSSKMNSKCRLVLQTNVCNGQEVCQFYRCLAFARFWKVKFWRSFIKCRYFNEGWTDFHKNIYLYIFILVFSKIGKYSALTPGQNDDPVTRTWKMTQMTHWPGDPVPYLSDSVLNILPRKFSHWCWRTFSFNFMSVKSWHSYAVLCAIISESLHFTRETRKIVIFDDFTKWFSQAHQPSAMLDFES